MFRLLAALIFALALSGPVRAQDPLYFGVVPQQSTMEILRRWQPFADYLAARLGHPVELRTARDIPSFEACLAAGAYDIAYMNPYHYVAFHEIAGYEAVGHRVAPRLHGILVVPADSPARSLADLAGKRIAFPARAAFGATLIQQGELRRLGIPFTPVYVKSHASAYLAVAGHHFEAGGGVMRTFKAETRENQAALRILHTTDGYTPHAFALAPAAAGYRPALEAALEAASEEAPETLGLIGTGPLEAAGDSAWNDIRSLGITPEESGLNTTPQQAVLCRSGGS